jgi:hypothetical protein
LNEECFYDETYRAICASKAGLCETQKISSVFWDYVLRRAGILPTEQYFPYWRRGADQLGLGKSTPAPWLLRVGILPAKNTLLLPQIRQVLLHCLHFQPKLAQISLQLGDLLRLGLVATLEMVFMAPAIAGIPAFTITSASTFFAHRFYSLFYK